MTDSDPRHDGNGGPDPLARVENTLEGYASSTEGSPPPGFADWVMRSVELEPMPRRGLIAGLVRLVTVPGPYRLAAQATLGAAIVVAGIGTAVVLDRALTVGPAPGGSPSPTQAIEGSPSPSLVPSPSPTPSETPDPTTPSTGPAPTSAETDDEHGGETPRPSETPKPSQTPES